MMGSRSALNPKRAVAELKELNSVAGADGLKRHKANDRLAPPLLKPDARFSRIRLSEGH